MHESFQGIEWKRLNKYFWKWFDGEHLFKHGWSMHKQARKKNKLRKPLVNRVSFRWLCSYVSTKKGKRIHKEDFSRSNVFVINLYEMDKKKWKKNPRMLSHPSAIVLECPIRSKYKKRMIILILITLFAILDNSFEDWIEHWVTTVECHSHIRSLINYFFFTFSCYRNKIGHSPLRREKKNSNVRAFRFSCFHDFRSSGHGMKLLFCSMINFSIFRP